MNRHLLRILGVFLFGFVLLSASLFYWQIYQAPTLLARADNPRRLEAKVREPRGRLLDRQGRVLVESVATGGRLQRRYTYPALVHVTGFDSSRYGNSGVEASRDAYLRGLAGRSTWTRTWDQLLHRYPATADVALTIDLDLQTAADAALGTRSGAVVVLESDSGRILALASHPFFDPNHLDDNWSDLSADPSRPFLSRAAQGLYAPGDCFTIVTLASALGSGTGTLDEVFTDVPGELTVEGTLIKSADGPRSRLTLGEAFQSSQAVVFAKLGLSLGWENLRRAIQAFWLDRPLPLEIDAAASALPVQDLLTQADLASTAVGQGRLSLTPLHMALVIAAVAGDGTIPTPRLVEDDLAGNRGQPAPLSRAMSPATAATLRSSLPRFEGGPASAPTLIGRSGLTQLGPGVEPHTWFLALTPDLSPRLAIAVLIENGGPNQADAVAVARQVVHAAARR